MISAMITHLSDERRLAASLAALASAAIDGLVREALVVDVAAGNEDFNPEVDGCETFVMNDGSVCEWSSPASSYTPKAR